MIRRFLFAVVPALAISLLYAQPAFAVTVRICPNVVVTLPGNATEVDVDTATGSGHVTTEAPNGYGGTTISIFIYRNCSLAESRVVYATDREGNVIARQSE